MNPSNKNVQSKKTKIALVFTINLLIFSVLILGAEFFLRLSDIKPWRVLDVAIQVDPGGRFFKRHPTLGYSHIPGKFTVTLETGYPFHVTHLPNTLRITHPLESTKVSGHKGEIWVFGGSFTHGWSINDEETYVWLLQKGLPEYEFVNFGVSGYGTIHSLLQFRDALKTNSPKVAVLAYAGWHDVRNTFSRIRRKQVAPWNRLGPLVQPYARLDKAGGLQYGFADVVYREFPMMRRSALVHLIEKKYNELEYNRARSHAVSEELVKEMARVAKEHNVKFILANISGGEAMLDFAKRNGILSIDMSVDLGLPGARNLPHDSHPSAISNQMYADKLETFLKAELSE